MNMRPRRKPTSMPMRAAAKTAIQQLIDSKPDAAKIDKFLAGRAVPIVEGPTVTFVWRGEANGVSLRHWIFGLEAGSAIARRLHAPAGLDDAQTDAWIDQHLRGDGELFSALARRLPLARNTHEFLADAQALHDIRKDLLRDS